MIFFLFVIVFILSFFLFCYADTIAKFLNLLDRPDNERKIHRKVTPKIGGLVFFINFLIINNFYFINTPHKDFAVFLNFFIGCFFIIFLLDDLIQLKAYIKTILFFCVVLFFFIFFEDFFLKTIYLESIKNKINLIHFTFLLNLICYFLLANSFNMSDGINGLAISIFCSWLFLISLQIKDIFIINYFILIIPFSLLFLIFNLKKNIFLGNLGSHLMPILIGSILIYTNNSTINTGNNGMIKSDLIFLIFLLPGLDLVRLFFFRVFIKKTNFYEGDNHHLHHYLVTRIGVFKTNLVFTLIILIPSLITFYNNSLLLICIIFTILTYMFLLLKKNKSK
jgi:UDP-GlcNAc:undecaprenyl-phosphate GlcNAc-1-phosphate transferase